MARAPTIVGGVFPELLALVLPSVCAGCRTPGPPMCGVCCAALTPVPRWIHPSPPPLGFPPATTSGEYDGVVRAALLAHKEHGRRAARPALANALAAAVELAAAGVAAGSLVDAVAAGSLVDAVAAGSLVGDRPLVLVPVPSSAAAIRARGGDPVGAMVASTARLLRAHCLPVLEQRRRLADQAGLDTAARAANLAGAFGLRRRATPRLRSLIDAEATIVVVDDVCTTGSTLAEAARVLRDAGVREPLAAVVAATRKRHPGSQPAV